MYWSLLFYVIWIVASQSNGQRRAAVDYLVTLAEEVESASENPLSSSINSIQTGREDLAGPHRGDHLLGAPFRRGYHKTTTPDYFKDSFTKSDIANAGKDQPSPTKAPETDAQASDGVKESGTFEVPTENRRGVLLTSLLKDERTSGSELSSSSVRSISNPKLDLSEVGKNSQKDEAKGSMDVANKGTPLREHTRRSNTHESRRQAGTQPSSSGAKYNVTGKDSPDRHHEELAERNQNDRTNTERRPINPAESVRGHRTVTRSAPDKGQILTHAATPRIPAPRYDRTDQPSVSSGTHERKAADKPLDGKDSSFVNADESRKVSDSQSDPHDKVYPTEKVGGTKVREDRVNSTVVNKPTHLLIGEERSIEVPRGPGVYRDERGTAKDDPPGKVISDVEKPSGGSEGRIYSERPYVRDAEERSPGYQGRDAERDYTRRQRDRYDERPHEERPLKDRQTHRERNATYTSQDRNTSRSSRPRDLGYDDDYRDDVSSPRDVIKDTGNIPRDRTRTSGRRPYTGTDDTEDRDSYGSDSTRSYRDYSDERRYRDDRFATDRDSTRRYNDEDSRKYAGDVSRTYDDDDYEDKDRYDRRYEKDRGSRSYEDEDTRRYTGSGSRRYEDEAARRLEKGYERPARGYKEDDEYTYNGTQRYRDNYDGYRDSNRRSSGDSGSSRRYYDSDGTRSTRYDDDDEYVGSRSYRDNDRKYVRKEDEDTFRQRDAARTYVIDDATGYRDADSDRRYRGETRVYSESSPKDTYDQDDKRAFEGDRSTYVGTHTYQERLAPSSRREYDDISRHRDNNGSRRSRGDESYRNVPYVEDEYFINRTSTSYIDRYDDSGRPQRRTDDDSVGYSATDGDNPKYISRSNDERRRDRDRVYSDVSSSRRRTDVDDDRGEKSRVYNEGRRADRSRDESYDDRPYRSRDSDGYIRSSRDRVKDYDTRVYRDSDDEPDTRTYRVRGEDRYRGDDVIRDRVADDELKETRPVSSRSRDKAYIDRRYEERDRDSDGTYRYREEDERYRNTPKDDGKPEYRDPESRSRGTQRFRDDYDPPYDRDSSLPRSSDERPRGVDRSSKREDRFVGDRVDVDDKVPVRVPAPVDTALRRDAKSELPVSRNNESPLKGERSIPYDDERRRDGVRSPSRDIQPDVRIPRTEYVPDDVHPKPRIPEDTADSFDKGDFARGRRTSFYSEDDKTDSDQGGEGAKRTRDDRHIRRTGDTEELPYTRDEKGRIPADDIKDLRQSDRPSTRPNTEGHTYLNRRGSVETSRHITKDEIPPNSRIPSDSLPISRDREYTSSSSSYERGSRRRLPTVREPEADRTRRRDEPEYKSGDPLTPESRGRYRYTKSRGDPEDFASRGDEESFAAGDEYVSRGTGSKSRDSDRRDTLKGEYGSLGPGTPTRSKEERIPAYPEVPDKEEYYPSGRDKAPPPRSGKPVVDARPPRDFDRREKAPQDRINVGRDDRVMYSSGEYPRSSPQDETQFKGENITRDHFDSSSGEARVKKENDPISHVVPQTVSGVRNQGSSISRSATPIPHFQDKEFMSRNTSGRNISDKFSSATVTREKRYQYDDRSSTNRSALSVSGINDELSKRPLTTKEVIEAAYRHTDEPEKQGEIVYPVYVPGSTNMTSPDIIRPSERRGITTPTKKKKKKCCHQGKSWPKKMCPNSDADNCLFEHLRTQGR